MYTLRLLSAELAGKLPANKREAMSLIRTRTRMIDANTFQATYPARQDFKRRKELEVLVPGSVGVSNTQDSYGIAWRRPSFVTATSRPDN